MHSMPPPRLAQPSPPIDLAIQAAEARQMLEAKSYRRLQRGEAPLDVEAEMAALLGNASERDAGKADLDRSCAPRCASWWSPATNGACARGKEPLDVEAEVERQVADFIGLGN